MLRRFVLEERKNICRKTLYYYYHNHTSRDTQPSIIQPHKLSTAPRSTLQASTHLQLLYVCEPAKALPVSIKLEIPNFALLVHNSVISVWHRLSAVKLCFGFAILSLINLAFQHANIRIQSGPKKWGHRLMTIILSNLNPLKNFHWKIPW